MTRRLGLPRVLAAAGALVCAASAAALASPTPAPHAASAPARTPPPGAWSTDSFDPREYFSATELRRWREESKPYRVIYFVKLPVDIAFYLLLLLTPLGLGLKRWSTRTGERLGRVWPFRTGALRWVARLPARAFGRDWKGALLFAYALFLAGVAVELPFALWSEYLNQRIGISNYTARAWIVDLLLGMLVTATLVTCLVFGLYGLIRRMPRRWWLVLALPAGLVMVGYGLVEPYTARIFYRLTPLERVDDPRRADLKRRLVRLAARAQIDLTRIEVIDTSRTTKRMNAYVSGLGRTRELVLYDNLLARATSDEIEVAVAHEIGHARRRNLLLTYGGGALALALLLWILAGVLRWGSRRLRYDGPGDVATLPLLGLTIMLVFNLIGPVVSCRARAEERAADRTALTLTGKPDAFISLMVKLARSGRSDVRPPAWVVFWFDNHPSIYERIATARWYRRWLRRRSRTGARSPGRATRAFMLGKKGRGAGRQRYSVEVVTTH